MNTEKQVEAQLYARLTYHEFLLEMVFEHLHRSAPDPIALLEATAAGSVKRLERTTMAPQGDVEFVQAFMEELRGIDFMFWRKVRKRLEDGLRKAGG